MRITEPPPGVEAAGVRRTFGDVVAVADVDLDVPPGQVTALVGPNGAGKTTLLLILATPSARTTRSLPARHWSSRPRPTAFPPRAEESGPASCSRSSTSWSSSTGLALLVVPALTAQSVNGDRERGVLAILQTTLLTPAEIAVGKLVAAWAVSLVFLVVSLPLIWWCIAEGGVSATRVACAWASRRCCWA